MITPNTDIHYYMDYSGDKDIITTTITMTIRLIDTSTKPPPGHKNQKKCLWQWAAC